MSVSRLYARGLAAAAILVFAGSSAAFAALSASATISTSQTSAPFNYTITLNNTGTTDIGTFWFAWTPIPSSYDFLPTTPTNIVAPPSWLAPVSHNGIPGDGYGIEWYNYFGSPIAAGQSQTFTFTSNDSPATLAGNAWFPPNKVGTSFVYVGFPQNDPGFKFDVQVVPEPTAIEAAALAGGLFALALLRQPKQRPGVHSVLNHRVQSSTARPGTFAKSESRVTSVAPRDRALAAIHKSFSSILAPARSRSSLICE